VIGTLSAHAERAGIPTCVISHDRDAFQLVSELVCVLLSPRGVTDVHVYTPDRVQARYGIPPGLIPDFIGLKGDPSDDIPGVPGIGDKTAADLLVRFGSLEGVFANLAAVPGEKRRETLREHEAEARRSRELATIERDLPVELDLEATSSPPDRTGIKDPAHFAYSTFAKSASQRRDNLRTSADGLKAKLEGAQRERDEALEQVSRADTPETRAELRNRRRPDRASTAILR